jgi:hypothetical protein
LRDIRPFRRCLNPSGFLRSRLFRKAVQAAMSAEFASDLFAIIEREEQQTQRQRAAKGGRVSREPASPAPCSSHAFIATLPVLPAGCATVRSVACVLMPACDL